MRNRLLPLLAFALTASIPPAPGSDPVGIYALIDRVVLEPAGGPAEHAQVWGLFSLAGEPGTGDTYGPPVRGHLYYATEPGSEEAARMEWSDLEKLAGTGQAVGFASRYMEKGTVRPSCAPAASPDPYPINFGLVKLEPDTLNPAVREFFSFPTPVDPVDCSRSVEPGAVTLVARNIADPERQSARYVFEIRAVPGASEASGEVTAGEGRTSWTPALSIEAGREYLWSVRAVDGSWTGPTAGAAFQLPFLRGDTNGDGRANVSNAVGILTHLFLGGPAPRPIAAGDMNDDRMVRLGDAVHLLSNLFLGSPDIPPPYPRPRPHPVSGRVGCQPSRPARGPRASSRSSPPHRRSSSPSATFRSPRGRRRPSSGRTRSSPSPSRPPTSRSGGHGSRGRSTRSPARTLPSTSR